MTKMSRDRKPRRREQLPLTVKRSELSLLKMVAGNEKHFTNVIDGDTVKMWVGFGWIDVGPARAIDEQRYPKVAED